MDPAIFAIAVLALLLALEKLDRRIERREQQRTEQVLLERIQRPERPPSSNGLTTIPAAEEMLEEAVGTMDDIDLVGTIQPNKPDDELNG